MQERTIATAARRQHGLVALFILSSGLLLGDAEVLVAQQPGPNRNVVSGMASPDDPEAFVKADVFLQRQNEPGVAVSSLSAEHLLAAGNDYRTIDVAEDFGLGETNEGLVQRLLAKLANGLARLLGRGRPARRDAAEPEAWIGVYRSCDRGRMWTGALLPGSPNDVSPASLNSPLRGLTAATDPVLATGHDGLAYLGGMAFDRGGESRIFVARYRDRLDREGGGCFVYERTTVVESGSSDPDRKFLDKPAIAADVPRFGLDYRPVYLTYTDFRQGMTRSRINFALSLDGGAHFSPPIRISARDGLAQGSAIAIDPRTGRVHIVWRDFLTDQVLIVSSPDFAALWSSKNIAYALLQLRLSLRPRPIHEGSIASYDQPTGEDHFRSNGFPTIAVDGEGKIFVAWQERVNALGEPDPFGTPRIVITVSEDGGGSWSERRAVDIADRIEERIQRGVGDVVARPSGPQVMPALSHGAGQLMLSYYEAREELSAVDGLISGVDRRMDVRAALLSPLDGSLLGSSVLVSEYPLSVEPTPEGERQLLEIFPGIPVYNRPNLPMFRAGTAAFIGDYVAVVPSQPLTRTGEGRWRWATALEDVQQPSFHTLWADNRNVLPPNGNLTGAWHQYSAPGSGALSCINPGSRDQDLFTSEIGSGFVAGSPSLFKPLLQPNGDPIQRALVLYLENRTGDSRRVNLTAIPTDPATTSASFDQFDIGATTLVDFEILPFSTLTRTVYLDSATDAFGSARVEVHDFDSGELLARVALNASASGFPLTNTDIEDSETRTPRLSNPRLSNPRLSNPRLSNESVFNPRLSNPRLSNESLSDEVIETTDVSVTVTNDGNTTSVFNLLTGVPNLDALLATGKYELQLILSRAVDNPSVGLLDPTCSAIAVFEDDTLSSVVDPRLSNPRLSNPRLSNVAFFLEPAEGAAGPTGDPGNEDNQAPLPVSSVTVTLRMFQTQPLDPGDPVFDPTTVSATVVAQAVDIVNGQVQTLPQFATVGPAPPIPVFESAADIVVPFPSVPTATSLAFQSQPRSTSAGQLMEPVAVRVVDAQGETVRTTGVAVSLALGANPGGGNLSGTLTRFTEGGVAVFDDLRIDQPGSGYTIGATAFGLAGAVSEPFDVLALPTVAATSVADSGPGSLREAIATSNASPGVDVITFDFSGAGPHVITLASPLPPLTDATILDGTTEPDFAPGAPSVVIDGSALTAGSGLVLTQGGSVVRGVTIVSFPAHGIEIPSDGNLVESSLIGTDATGADLGNGQTGISIGGSDNTVGGDVALGGSLLRSWGGQGVGNGRFGVFPRSIAFDPASGDVYVTDTTNDRIQRFDSDGNFVLAFGTSGDGDGQFTVPRGIATDSDGNVYVTDEANHRVQKFDSGGNFLSKWGTNGSAAGELDEPWGIAVGTDPALGIQVVYVSDRMNHRIQKFDTNGGFLLEWGSLGTGPGELDGPRGVALDPTGNLYVADSRNHRVQKFDGDGNPLLVVGSLGLGSGEIEGPESVATDSAGRLYVTEILNNRFQVFDSDGAFVAVRGAAGVGDGELLQPTGIGIDANDDLYILRAQSPRVQKFRALSKSDARGNTIAFNDAAGVVVSGGRANAVLGNEIFGSPQSIDTGAPGRDPNGAGLPVLVASRGISGYAFAQATGTLNNTPSTTFRVDFFFSTTCTQAAGGEGRELMGSTRVATDLDGAAGFTAYLPFEAAGPGFVSATATPAAGNTTELSECVPHVTAEKLLSTDFLEPRLPRAIAGQPYTVALGFVGGTPPVVFRPFRTRDADELGAVGLSLDPSGTFTGSPVAGSAMFEVELEDAGDLPQRDIQTLLIGVVPPVAITATALADGKVGDAYSEMIFASGGSQSLSYVVVGGALPPGLDLDPATGAITGVPSESGDFPFTVEVSEANADFPAQSAAGDFDIFVEPSATRVGFLVQPGGTEAGQAIAPPVRVTIQDDFGKTVTSSQEPVTLAVGSGPGELAGTTTVDAVDGIALFDDVSIDFVGSYTLLASSVGLESATSDVFDVLPSSSPIVFPVTNANDGGPGSLRQAMLKANANAGQTDTVSFALPGPGPHSIAPLSALPALTDPVNLDGTTQPGFAGAPIVEIDGSSAGAASPGLQLLGGDSTVSGLVVNRFLGAGVLVASDGNVIRGSYVGTDVSGSVDLGNGANGIHLIDAANNIIGGTQPGARNVVSGNSGEGIRIDGSVSTLNTVSGNYIGTSASGDADLGNGASGIFLRRAPGNSVVGNVVSGNDGFAGIAICGNLSFCGGGDAGTQGSDAAGNVVQGNLVGTDASGAAALGNGQRGISVDGAPSTTIGGSAPAARNVVSGNGAAGIHLFNAANGANVEGNYVGLDAGGTRAIANLSSGVTVSGSSAVTIRGNVISGNATHGVNLGNSSSNDLFDNRIGTDHTGASAVGNAESGVFLDSASENNTIGGTAAGTGNLVSGNLRAGVKIRGRLNRVLGNRIGTDVTGSSGLGNGDHGVHIDFGQSNTVGGATAGSRNVISGNSGSGVLVGGRLPFLSTPARSNVVQGNYIGTDLAGASPIPNQNGGVDIREDAAGNTVEDNVVSANRRAGLSLLEGTTGNGIFRNRIGTDPAGKVVAGLGNEGPGISVESDASRNVLVLNVIAGNAGDGIVVTGANTGENPIGSNSIFGNAGLGIDLGGDGVTANDVGDADAGPNDLLNFPVLTAATTDGSLLIRGTLDSTPDTQFEVQYFSNEECDPSGNGEGRTFLGTTSLFTNLEGRAFLNTTLPAIPAGAFITATASVTSEGPDTTSEFSNCRLVVPELAVTTPSLPDGTAGTPYLETLTTTGGTGATSWSVSGGPLPPGLALSADGVLSGTPTTAGSFDVILRVEDSDTPPQIVQEPFSITVNPGQPVRMSLEFGLVQTSTGTEFFPDATVRVQDELGNTVTSATNAITMAIGVNPPGSGSLLGTTVKSAVAGVAVFDDLGIDTVGDGYTLVAASSGLAGAESNRFRITPGVPKKLGFVVQPSDVRPAAAITPPVEVEFQDEFGNRSDFIDGTVIILSFASNPANASLSGTTTVAAVDGVSVFPDLSIDAAGTFTIEASSGIVTPAVSDPFDVQP